MEFAGFSLFLHGKPNLFICYGFRDIKLCDFLRG